MKYLRRIPGPLSFFLIVMLGLTSGASAQITASFQDGVNGYSGTRDTKLIAGSSTTNYGSAAELEMDGSPDMSGLLMWDLTSIPAGSNISSVDFTMYVTSATDDEYELYPLLRPWVENEATWNQYANGQNWATAGASGAADRGNTVLGSITVASKGLYTMSLNSAGIAQVQAWVNDPASNFGFIIQDYEDARDGLDFSSSEHSDVARRPALIVTYVENSEPTISIDDVAVNEPSSGSVTAEFTVSLLPAASDVVTVNFATADGTAVAPGDYVATSGQVTFQPGETSQPVSVTVNSDAAVESDESFVVNLTNAVNALISDNQGTGTISPVNQAPTTSGIADVNVAEDAPNTVINLFSAFDDAEDPDAALTYTVENNTNPGLFASTDIDGTAGTLTLVYAADANGTADLTVRASDTGSPALFAETTFTVNVSDVNDAPVRTAGAVNSLTVLQNDPATSLGLTGVTYGSGGGADEAGQTLSYAVTAVPPSTLGNVVLADGTTVVAPGPYTLAQIQGMQFLAATDALGGPETFAYDVTDDGTTGGAADPQTLTESLNISVSEVSTEPITVEVRVNASSDDAEERHDGTVKFISKDMELVDDPTATQNGITQTVGIRWTNLPMPQGATITKAYIQFEAAGPDDEITSIDFHGEAADSSVTYDTIDFHVSSRPTTSATVNWQPVEWTTTGEAGPDQRTPDMSAIIQEIVNRPGWKPGNALAMVVTGAPESERKVVSYDGDVRNGTNGAALLHVEYIPDANAPPSISIDDVAIDEGDSGTTNLVFTVTLSKTSNQTVTVDYATADNTAIAPGDYTSVSNQLSFSPGETSKPITVAVNGDVVNEPNETFFVNLSNPVNAFMGDGQGEGTITNDDASGGFTTVTFQEGTDGYSGTIDTQLDSTSPTTNYGALDRIEMDGSPDMSTLIKWDISSIPSGSVVQTVEMTLYIRNGSTVLYDIYEMLRPWDESNSNWNQFAAGQNWQVAGANGSLDRGNTSLGAITGSRGPATFTLNASGIAVVQSWIDNPGLNNGFAFLDYDEGSNGLSFLSSERDDIVDRPLLSVTYSSGGTTGMQAAKASPDGLLPNMGEQLFEVEELPEEVALNYNYPNPFNVDTRIEYALPEQASVRMEIYNIRGQLVRVLVDNVQPAGFKSVVWDGRDDSGRSVASGVYFNRLWVDQQNLVRKIVLQK